MSKKDKELKKLKKKKKKEKVQDMYGMVATPFVNEDMIIKDKSLSLEERIYSIPYMMRQDFENNKRYQLDKAGLLEKYSKQFIMFTYRGMYSHQNPELENYVGVVTTEIKNAFLDKRNLYIGRRSEVEYSPEKFQYVGACVVTSENYILLLKSISGRLEGKYTMVQGHVDYDLSFMYTDTEPFIAKNAYRELIEEIKFEDGSILPVENMDTEVSYFINKNETLIDIEHIGFVYQYRLTDEEIQKVVSAEPEKHNVCVIPKAELMNEENVAKFDSWLSSIAPLIK